jgi:glycine cleavage system H protein
LAGVVARALGLTKIRREEEAPILYLPIVFDGLKRGQLERMWCIPQHAWAMLCEDGSVRIGLDALYRRLLHGEIERLGLPEIGEHVVQGEACAVITVMGTAETVPAGEARHNLWCPIGGIVVATNADLQDDLSLLARSPYGRGWLLRVEPSQLDEDLRSLEPFTESIGGRAAQKRLAVAGTD